MSSLLDRTFEQCAKDPVGTVYEDGHENGVRFIIVRGPHSLCAYIGVPPDHPLAGRDYDDIPLEVHGGLTFGALGDGEHYPAGTFWYGWDYGHSQDRPLYDLNHGPPWVWGTGWTPALVRDEIRGVTRDFAKLMRIAETPVYRLKRAMRRLRDAVNLRLFGAIPQEESNMTVKRVFDLEYTLDVDKAMKLVGQFAEDVCKPAPTAFDNWWDKHVHGKGSGVSMFMAGIAASMFGHIKAAFDEGVKEGTTLADDPRRRAALTLRVLAEVMWREGYLEAGGNTREALENLVTACKGAGFFGPAVAAAEAALKGE